MNPTINHNAFRFGITSSSSSCVSAVRPLLVACFAIALVMAVTPTCSPVLADEWMTWSSTYTHSPDTGRRIDQYAQPVQPMGPTRDAFQQSGYRHYRSTLNTGRSSDNVHIVEKWGEQVVPYEQWRFPYRPYGVPYDLWGPQAPYGIINGAVGIGGYPGAGLVQPRGQQPGQWQPPANRQWSPPVYPPPGYGSQPSPWNGQSRGFPLQPTYRNQPWYDGTYPVAPPLDNRSDAEFFYHPPLGRPASP